MYRPPLHFALDNSTVRRRFCASFIHQHHDPRRPATNKHRAMAKTRSNPEAKKTPRLRRSSRLAKKKIYSIILPISVLKSFRKFLKSIPLQFDSCLNWQDQALFGSVVQLRWILLFGQSLMTRLIDVFRLSVKFAQKS